MLINRKKKEKILQDKEDQGYRCGKGRGTGGESQQKPSFQNRTQSPKWLKLHPVANFSSERAEETGDLLLHIYVQQQDATRDKKALYRRSSIWKE